MTGTCGELVEVQHEKQIFLPCKADVLYAAALGVFSKLTHAISFSLQWRCHI